MRKFNKIFLDSDVVISSLLSSEGAASQLLSTEENLELFVSNLSEEELQDVAARLGIDETSLEAVLKNLNSVDIGRDLTNTKEKFSSYVSDKNDAHVVAGAVGAKAKFLTTYNLKHLRTDRIKNTFDIVVLSPGSFLQYLRSR